MVELVALCAGAVKARWTAYFFAIAAIADYISSFTAWSQIRDQVEDQCTYTMMMTGTTAPAVPIVPTSVVLTAIITTVYRISKGC
jgi:hypothetical protein